MRPALGFSVRITAFLVMIAVALLVASSGRQQVEATVEALTIDSPSKPTGYGSAPVNVPVTFTWSESHVCGPYRATVTIGSLADPVAQQTFVYEPGEEIRSAPSPCSLGQGTETYTFTHSIRVPASTSAGSYDLTVHVEENWPPGSDSWGFDLVEAKSKLVKIGGGAPKQAILLQSDSGVLANSTSVSVEASLWPKHNDTARVNWIWFEATVPGLRCSAVAKGEVKIFSAGKLVWQKVGPDAPHGPVELLGSIQPRDPCWCGRGKAYETCDRPGDIARAISAISRSGGLRS